jgi:hypothetical protein
MLSPLPRPPSFLVEDLEAPRAIVDFRYDYAGLENASEIQEHTLAIRACMRRTVEEGIEIGKHITAVHELIQHGKFRKWLDSEVGMSYMAATRFMRIYEVFSKRSNKLLHLPATLSVAYEIASPSFPKETRDRLIEGEAVVVGGTSKTIDQLTVKDVQELKPPEQEECPFGKKQECPDRYMFSIILNLKNPVEFIQQTTSIILRLEELTLSLGLSYETREIEQLEAALQGGKRAVNKFNQTMKDCLSYVKYFMSGVTTCQSV